MSATFDSLPTPPPAQEGLARKALRYLFTGGAAFVVDLGSFHLLLGHLPGVLWPAVASFVLAAVVNYLLTSIFVFRQPWRSWRRAGLFMLYASVGLCINASVTWGLAHSLPIIPELAKAGGVAVAFGANFLMNAFFVFKPGAPRG